MHRRWQVSKTNPEYITYLSRTASVSPAVAQVLVNRGIKTPEAVSSFMAPALSESTDPMSIEGMASLVDAVGRAAKEGKKVFVHGDYDADGVCATAILVSALRSLGIETDYYIPNRFRDGYGFNPPAVKKAGDFGAALVITVDCGITGFEAAQATAEAGMELVITDHHEPELDEETGSPRLPEAKAIINPKLSGDPAASVLSGAGIAFKAVQALTRAGLGKIETQDFIDLAALGTVADSVPLTGDNRAIVREGLESIVKENRPGVSALKAASSIGGRRISAGLLAFTLVPRINAAGRLSDAGAVVDMLVTDEQALADRTARELAALNSERQKIEEAVLNEALALVEQRGAGPAIVLAQEGWHEGVLGIVASRIAERYFRPAFVMRVEDGMAKGSARSVQGFDVHAGLAECHELLAGYGGHKQAAGLRLMATELEAFESKMGSLVEAALKEFTPTLEIDATVELREVTFGLVDEISSLEPFGYGNPEPVFGAKDLTPMNPRVVGNNHLKVKLRSNNCAHEAIGWGMGDFAGFVEDAGAIDAAFTATINEWKNGRVVQLNLKGVRSSQNS